jgi:hypothetical protein
MCLNGSCNGQGFVLLWIVANLCPLNPCLQQVGNQSGMPIFFNWQKRERDCFNLKAAAIAFQKNDTHNGASSALACNILECL